MPPSITLHAADAAACLSAPRWWELASLRRLLHGQPATNLGYDAGPEPEAPLWAFLAIDVTNAYAPALQVVRRFFVVLPGRALLTLDVAEGKGPVEWSLIPDPVSGLLHRAVPDAGGPAAENDHILFHMLSLPGRMPEPLLSVDLAGARAGSTVVLFHTETGMARSAVFFDVAGGENLQFVIAGLAPGPWDIWRDGYLEEMDRMVRPESGVLAFAGPAGNYFIRHR